MPHSRPSFYQNSLSLRNNIVILISLIAGGSFAIAPGMMDALQNQNTFNKTSQATLKHSFLVADNRSERMRQLALQLVNRDRKRNGLATLAEDRLLNQAATAHAEDMLRRNFYNHINPDGKGPVERFAAVGGTGPATDNLAYLQQPGWQYAVDENLLKMVHKGWMNSPGHRSNILNPQAGRFGFGMAVSAKRDRVYMVQMFALPK